MNLAATSLPEKSTPHDPHGEVKLHQVVSQGTASTPQVMAMGTVSCKVSNIDLIVKTEMWASGFPSLPPLTSSMMETVEFTHLPFLPPDDVWAGTRPLFCLTPTPTPPPLPRISQSLARAEGMATPPRFRQPRPVTRRSPHPTELQVFGTVFGKRVRGVSVSITSSLAPMGTELGQ